MWKKVRPPLTLQSHSALPSFFFASPPCLGTLGRCLCFICFSLRSHSCVSFARFTAKSAKALGNHLWPLMENAGMFGPSWQLVACESLTELPFPVGAMRWSPSSTGPKYVDWLDLWGNLTAGRCVVHSCKRAL